MTTRLVHFFNFKDEIKNTTASLKQFSWLFRILKYACQTRLKRCLQKKKTLAKTVPLTVMDCWWKFLDRLYSICSIYLFIYLFSLIYFILLMSDLEGNQFCFPSSPDVSLDEFGILLDCHFNQKSRLGTCKNTNLILKTSTGITLKIVAFYLEASWLCC